MPDLRVRVIGKLALGVVVVHEHHQPRAVADLRPFQHLLIAVRINPRRSLRGRTLAGSKSFLDYGRALSDDRRMDTIEEYKIIQSENLGSLAKEVNAALKEGWQPHGAPFVHISGAAVVCCQAMVNFHQPTGAETIAKLRRAAVSAFRR